MPPAHSFIDLIGPLLGCRVEHAFVAGTAGADLLAAEHRDQFGGAEVTGPAPVREAEAVNLRVEAGVGAVGWVQPRAVREGVTFGKVVTATCFSIGEHRRLCRGRNL